MGALELADLEVYASEGEYPPLVWTLGMGLGGAMWLMVGMGL